MFKFLFSILTGFMLMTSVALAAVNINSADTGALASLTGIGPVKAERIVAYRQQNGAFHSVAELARVKGIGPKTLEKLGSEITVGR